MRERLSKGEKKNRVEVDLPVPDFDEFEKDPNITFPPDEIAREAKIILKDLEREDEEERKKKKVEDPLHNALTLLADQAKEMIKMRDEIKLELASLRKKKDQDSIERARVDKLKIAIVRQELKKVSDKIEDLNSGDDEDLKINNAIKIVNRRIAGQLVAPIIEQVAKAAAEKTEPLLRVAIKSRFRDRDLTRLTNNEIDSLGGYVSVLAADKVKPFMRDHMSSVAYEEFVKTGSPLADMIRDGMSKEMHKVYGKLKIEFLMAEIADYARKRKEIEEASKAEGISIGNLSDAEVDALWNKIQISKAREAKSLELENAKRAEVIKTDSKIFEPFFNENFLHKEFVKFLAKSNFKEVPDSTNPYSKENCWFNPENYRVIKSRFLKEMFNENASSDARLRHELEIESFLQKQKRAYMVKVSGEKHIAEMEANLTLNETLRNLREAQSRFADLVDKQVGIDLHSDTSKAEFIKFATHWPLYIAKGIFVSAPRRAFGWVKGGVESLVENIERKFWGNKLFIGDDKSSKDTLQPDNSRTQQNKIGLARMLENMTGQITSEQPYRFKLGDYVKWDQEKKPVEARAHDIYKIVSIYSPYDKDEDNIHAELVTGPNKGVIYTFHPKYIKKVDLGQNPDVEIGANGFLRKESDRLKDGSENNRSLANMSKQELAEYFLGKDIDEQLEQMTINKVDEIFAQNGINPAESTDKLSPMQVNVIRSLGRTLAVDIDKILREKLRMKFASGVEPKDQSLLEDFGLRLDDYILSEVKKDVRKYLYKRSLSRFLEDYLSLSKE